MLVLLGLGRTCEQMAKLFIVLLQDEHLRTSSAEMAATDPTSALITELLSIQMDMKTYQQDRKQLR